MSTSEDLKIALEFAFPFDWEKEEETKKHALFFISISNYLMYSGMRMNTECHSAYPKEQELLLLEGARVYVLDVEEVIIDNKSESFKKYDGS